MKVSKKKYILVPVVFFLIFLSGAIVVYVIPAEYEASALISEEHASEPKAGVYQLTETQCMILVKDYLILPEQELEGYFFVLHNKTKLEITEDLKTRISMRLVNRLEAKHLIEDLLKIRITWDWYNLTKEWTIEDFKAFDAVLLQQIEVLRKKSDVDYYLEDAEENFNRKLAIQVLDDKSTFEDAVDRIVEKGREKNKTNQNIDKIDFEGNAIESLSSYLTEHQLTLDKYKAEVEKLEKIESEHPNVADVSLVDFEVLEAPFTDYSPVFPNVKLGLMISQVVACLIAVLLLVLFLWMDKRKRASISQH